MTRLFHRWYKSQAARLACRRGFSYARQNSHVEAIAAFTEAIDKESSQSAQARLARGLSHVQTKGHRKRSY